MLSFIFLAFVAYLVFRLVFDFVIPIYRTTQKVKKGFRDMQQKMNGQPPEAPPNPSSHRSSAPSTKAPAGDYIDFEEVKD